MKMAQTFWEYLGFTEKKKHDDFCFEELPPKGLLLARANSAEDGAKNAESSAERTRGSLERSIATAKNLRQLAKQYRDAAATLPD